MKTPQDFQTRFLELQENSNNPGILAVKKLIEEEYNLVSSQKCQISFQFLFSDPRIKGVLANLELVGMYLNASGWKVYCTNGYLSISPIDK